MQAIKELKELCVRELESYLDKDLSLRDLDTIDKLARTAKNLCKLMKYMEEDGYAEKRGRSMRAPRDSMGRYSKDSKMFKDELMCCRPA